MMTSEASRRVTLDREAIARFCQKHHIRRLGLFGSVLRDDFRPSSDVDVLVEFEPGARVGLLRQAAIESELSAMLGRTVDTSGWRAVSSKIARGPDFASCSLSIWAE